MIKKESVQQYLYNIFLGVILVLGIYLKLKGYFSNSSLWHDECALAWNIKFKHYSEFFGVLNFDQMAPPLFMITTKFLTAIFGASEYVFRFIPILIGCLSMPAFYLLAQKVLTKKFNILIALFLFAINTSLLNYSFEFKPYVLDVFFTIICLLFFINLDLAKLSIKKTLIYGISLAVLPWVSFVSTFIISGGFLNLIFKNIKTEWKKKLILILPIFISFLTYLKIYLINNYANSSYLMQFWGNNFTNRGIKMFILLLAKNLYYLFDPIKYVLFVLILLFLGIIILFKEKSKFVHISITAIFLLILASSLHLYPFAERLILFLLLIFLLYIIKPLDLVSSNKKFISLIIILLFASSFYPQIGRVSSLITAKKLDRKEYAKEMLDFMMKKIKPNDIIYINTPSYPDFAYYASFLEIKNQVIQEKIETNISEKKYINGLNNLQRGYYWFYIPIDYINVPVSDLIDQWAKTQKVIYSYKINQTYKSLLMYVYVK